MAVDAAYRVGLERGFDSMRRIFGNPVIYIVPPQTPAGLTYSEDYDAWLDGGGNVVTKTPSELTSVSAPALWGQDAETVLLALGGTVNQGDLIALTKASYAAQLRAAIMIVTGSITGDIYDVDNVENAPDGGAAVFAVARLRRKES